MVSSHDRTIHHRVGRIARPPTYIEACIMNTVLTFLRDHRERLALERRGVPSQLTAALLTPRFQTRGT